MKNGVSLYDELMDEILDKKLEKKIEKMSIDEKEVELTRVNSVLSKFFKTKKHNINN